MTEKSIIYKGQVSAQGHRFDFQKLPKTVYERNFDKLVKIGIIKPDGSLNFEEYLKLESDGFMPLSIDHLSHKYEPDSKTTVISMAHNYEQNGDLMADPDMEIRIFPELKMIEALTYQQDSLGIYQQVYIDKNLFYPKLKKDLNAFLSMWLNNLIAQGFSNKGD